MNFHIHVNSFAAFLPLVMTFILTAFSTITFGQDSAIELIPVDAGAEDRGAIGSSLRVVRSTYQQDHSFEKLYKVAGSDDIYVRKSGGLLAVFRNSEYISTPAGDIPIVPAGTVYCIGEIRPELIGQLGLLQEPLPNPETMVTAERVTEMKSSLPSSTQTEHHPVQFLEDESYRRQRLASFVLEIVLSE